MALDLCKNVLFVCLFVRGFTSRVNNLSFWETSWVIPVISNGDEVSCSRTKHRAPGEDVKMCLSQYLHVKTRLGVLEDVCHQPKQKSKIYCSWQMFFISNFRQSAGLV